MVTEYIQGAIAFVLVLALTAVALLEQVQGRPFSEPLTLSSLTALAVGFYFGRSGQVAQRAAAAQAADHALAGVATARVLQEPTPPPAAPPAQPQP